MKDLSKDIHELFDVCWDEEMTDEQEDEFYTNAKKIIKQYGWKKVFSELMNYLQINCKTPEFAMNVAHLFWDYGWYENFIPEPYKFLGFFYNAISFKISEYDDSDILDSLATTILANQGINSANLRNNPYYVPEEDPMIISAAEKWKEKS